MTAVRSAALLAASVAFVAACSAQGDDANDGFVPVPKPDSAVTTSPATTTSTVARRDPATRLQAQPDRTTTTTTSSPPTTTTTTTLPPDEIAAPGERTPLDGLRRLAWDWSAPCQVPVTDVRTENGLVAERSLLVTVTPEDDAFLVEIEMLDIEVRGLTRSRELELLELARATAVGLVVDVEGYVVDLRGSDEAVVRLGEFLVEGGLLDEDELDAFLADEEVRVDMEVAATDEFWWPWVSNWASYEFVAGEPSEHTVSPEFEAVWVFEALGEYADGTIHLRDEILYAGDDVNRLIFGDADEPDGYEGTIRYRYEAILDPATLRPDVAVFVEEEDLVDGDGADADYYVRQESTFRWDEAVGCA